MSYTAEKQGGKLYKIGLSLYDDLYNGHKVAVQMSAFGKI